MKEYIVHAPKDSPLAIEEYSTFYGEPVKELVRCENCKFATITNGVYSRKPEVKYCDIWFPTEAEYMPIDYYCASAEKKEECAEDNAKTKSEEMLVWPVECIDCERECLDPFSCEYHIKAVRRLNDLINRR